MTNCSSFRTILLAAALGACTSNGGQSLADFYTNVADTYCAVEVTCHRQPDDATCKLALSSVTTSDQATLIADVNAGIVKFDVAVANACLDQAMSAPCEYGPSEHWLACAEGAITGTIANGGSCFAGGECVSQDCEAQSTSCDPESACCQGTCVASTFRIALGAACNVNPSCVDGAFCDFGSGTCVPQIATAGTACDPTAPSCVEPLACIPDGTSAETGTCQPLAAEGADCSIDAQVACVDSRDYCNTTTKKCTPQAAVGLACSSDVPCQGLAICTGGICVEKSAPGSACTPSTTDNACLGLIQCVDGTCAAEPEPAGSSCR